MAIKFGNEFEFLGAGSSLWVVLATIDDSKFVVAYRDDADSGHGTAKIGTVSGTDTTFGAEAEFLGVPGADYISTDILDSSGFVVAYRDTSDSNHGTARIGEVSGTTITFGSDFEFVAGGDSIYNRVSTLDANNFVVAYRDNTDSGHGTAKIGNVSGTTISFGAESEFTSAGAVDEVAVVALSSSGFVVSYRDQADSLHGTAKFATVSGTTITFGAETEFLSTGEANRTFVERIDDSKFIVIYNF